MTTFHFVRHGESYGNAAAKEAQKSGALRLDIPWDTPDIPLTQEGIHQSMRIKCPPSDVIVTSPYNRALETMKWALPDLMYNVDYRLVDKASGVFDKLSVRGMQELYPHEWAARQEVGKFHHRPPNGESWLDVALRVGNFIRSVSGRFNSVLVFTHDVPILTAIMICGRLSPSEILQYQKDSPIENGSITTLIYEGDNNAHIDRIGLESDRNQPVGVA